MCITNLQGPFIQARNVTTAKDKSNFYPYTRAVLYNTKSISFKAVSEF